MAKPDIVLLHGAFHGGWCWRYVADPLRAQGFRVFTPTLTGLGERRHLMSRDITLETFVTDLLGVIAAEELQDFVLVGHSFGTNVIAAVADHVPERIGQLVFLDGCIQRDGESSLDAMPAMGAERKRLADESSGGLSVPPPPPAAFGVPDGPMADWVARQTTPHPYATFTSKQRLAHPIGSGRPCTYIACTAHVNDSLEDSRRWIRSHAGWQWREIFTGHNAMVTAPEALTRMLAEIAG